MRLKDKVAIITGSTVGIGRATAILFAREGAKIVVNSRSRRKEVDELVKEIKDLGSEAFFIQADISKPDDVEKLFQKTLDRFKKVDILVNNAGIHNPKSFFRLSKEDWQKILETNLIGVFLCSQAAARIMVKKNSGKIINIASVRGLEHCGRPGNIDYSASKAGVINFTKSLSKALAPNITVNAVAPGPTDTGMSSWKPSDLKYTYLGRLIKPEEVASAILFLASDEAGVINGEVLVVDGGYSLKL
jgi:3-oxoacyl-[acyl-carrier protein] reductase